ncbi:MAG: DUF4286 family protein [Rikenellaceae bacterium]
MGYMLNISFMVEPTVYGSWYNFMFEKFIPFVKTKEEFIEPTFSRILSDGVNSHYTFSLLVHLQTLDGYNLFKNEIMHEYSEFAQPMFGAKVTHFMTLMKKI